MSFLAGPHSLLRPSCCFEQPVALTFVLWVSKEKGQRWFTLPQTVKSQLATWNGNKSWFLDLSDRTNSCYIQLCLPASLTVKHSVILLTRLSFQRPLHSFSLRCLEDFNLDFVFQPERLGATRFPQLPFVRWKRTSWKYNFTQINVQQSLLSIIQRPNFLSESKTRTLSDWRGI